MISINMGQTQTKTKNRKTCFSHLYKKMKAIEVV